MESFIDVLLHRLITTSVQTALLSAVVWMLCRHVRRLAPATQCWLWWLVTLQALLGLFASPVELPWLPQVAAAVPQVAATQWTALPTDGIALAPLTAEYARPWWPDIALSLWMAGLVAMAWIIACKWRHGHQLLQYSTPCSDGELQQMLTRAVMVGDPVRMPQLRLSDDINSPLLIGQLRPVLLLPATTSLSSEELEMALAHELAHLRRGDLWWGWVPSLARLLFFFHPLVHLAVREYGIAREAACDAAVVAAGQRSRRDYGRLLLRLGTTAHPGHGLAAASPTFSSLKRRLTMLQHTSFLSRAGSLALLAVITAGVMPLRFVAAATSAPNAGSAATAQAQPWRTAASRTATPPATPSTAATPAAAERRARNESETSATAPGTAQPSVADAPQVLMPQSFNRARTDQSMAFLDSQLREAQRRLAEAQASLQHAKEAQAGRESDIAARDEIASLEQRSRRSQAMVDQLTKQMAVQKSLPDAYPMTQLQSTAAYSKLLQRLQQSQATESRSRRALQPATRPRYQALFTQYETECQTKAEQWSRLGAQGALEKATCLEQAEQRAYREASTAEQAAEKEALVEQRRRAAMGLPPAEANQN